MSDGLTKQQKGASMCVPSECAEHFERTTQIAYAIDDLSARIKELSNDTKHLVLLKSIEREITSLNSHFIKALYMPRKRDYIFTGLVASTISLVMLVLSAIIILHQLQGASTNVSLTAGGLKITHQGIESTEKKTANVFPQPIN